MTTDAAASYYLLGPMSGLPEYNREGFESAAAALRARGIKVVSPMELDAKEGFDFSRKITRDEYLSFLRRDCKLIASRMAAGQIRGGIALPGWQRSEGARIEVALIRGLGGEVIRYPNLDPLRHPGSERFHQILGLLAELHDNKAADYGTDGDPFANVRASSEWGMPSWVGCMIRATDKVRRLQTFARRGTLRNEGVIDSFLDLAVYSIIGLILFEDWLSDQAEKL